jgi:hypothetical protein
LKDPFTRGTYDILYYQVRLQWLVYRSAYDEYVRKDTQEHLEAERERARVLEEQKRQAEEKQRRAEELAEEARRQQAKLQGKALAEERTRKQALRALLERHIAAEVHLRKVQEADARSAKVTRAARAEQEARARECIAKQEAEKEAREKKAREKEEEERQAQAYQQTFSEEVDTPPPNLPSSSQDPPKPAARDLEKLKKRRIHIARIWAQEKHISHAASSLTATGSIANPTGEYVDLGWDKKDCASVCDFCDRTVKLYAFVCPLAYAVACEACVVGLSFCAKSVVGGEVRGEGVGMGEEEGKWEKVGRKKGKGKERK